MDVMGDMYRYRNDTSKLKHVQIVGVFKLCVCVFSWGKEALLPKLMRGRCCAQSTDGLALVVRQSMSAAMTPLSQSPKKNKPVMVEDDGELYTLNLCKDLQSEATRQEGASYQQQAWKLPVAEKSSRPAEIYAKNLLKEVAEATSL